LQQRESDTMSRNLSINAYFRHRAARHNPRLRYAGQKFESWQRELLTEARSLLGTPPRRVPLNPEIQAEWSEEGVVKQRIVFDVEDGLSAVAYLFRPENFKGKLPGILACHGHGPFGKESVMGNRSSPQLVTDIVNHNYDYGLQMAQAGFAVIAIDWRGFGERDDRRKPHFHDVDSQHPHKRDLCDLHYLRATVLGQTVLGMDVHDGTCAIDLLCQQPFVDANRIGVMGLSFGGAMSTWMSICDSRIKATDIICYSDRFADFGMRDVNFCGSQVVPGLYDLCDVPDLHGVIAPRPLLVEIGAYDECFKIDSAMSCYREVEKIYAAAGVSDCLELDLFEGGHRWGGNKSLAFFRKYLGGSAIADDGREIEVTTTAAVKRSSRAILREIASDAAPFAIGGGGSGSSTPAGDGDGSADRQG
jgi:dienelactone hydrolase